MRNLTSLIALLALTAACDTIPEEAYFDRGQPESLLDQSSEVVNFDIYDTQSITELTNWVNQDQPSRAELYCMEGDATCMETEQVLNQFGVPVTYSPSSDNMVTLVYERILARDCENRYIDNSINPYNLTHPTYGCSLAVNMVQQVTDKRQFTSPALLGYTDGLQTQRVMDSYRVPYQATAPISNPNMEYQFEIDLQSNG